MSTSRSQGTDTARRSWLARALLAGPVFLTGSLLVWISGRSITSSASRAGATAIVPDPRQLANRKPVVLERDHVMVMRDGDRLAAISLVCTHLGCGLVVRDRGFECRCHGSRFDGTGRRLTGPADRDLPWYRIDMLPDGRAAIRLGDRVPSGTFTAL